MNHIKKYPFEISHYNRGKESVEVFYLEGNLSCQKMYNFIKITQSSITYNRFSTIFNDNFNLRFRKHRTDICQLCYDYEIQLKKNQNNFNLQL